MEGAASQVRLGAAAGLAGRLSRSRWPHVLLAALAALAMAVLLRSVGYDSDVWWILATGREIAESGIPHVNPFSSDGGGIVVQQWLHCLVVYGVYSAFGDVGLNVLVVSQTAGVLLCLLLAARSVRGRLDFVALDFALLSALFCLPYMVTLRPAPWTMILLLLSVSALWRYRAGGGLPLLAVPVVSTLLGANLQSSMLPLYLLVVVAAALPVVTLPGRGVKASQERSSAPVSRADNDCDSEPADGSETPHRAAQGFLGAAGSAALGLLGKMGGFVFSRWPYLACALLCFLASFANPYGVGGAYYVFRSYGVAGEAFSTGVALIIELRPLDLGSPYGILYLAGVACAAWVVAYRCGRDRRLDAGSMLLLLCGALSCAMHLRCLWFMGLLMLPALCQAPLAVGEGASRAPALSGHLLCAADVLAALALAVCLVPGAAAPLEMGSGDGVSTPEGAVAYLEGHGASGAEVYTGFNSGGYMEWRGFDVTLDARPEVWDEALSGVSGMHRFADYAVLADGGTSHEEKLDVLRGVRQEWLLLDGVEVEAGARDAALELGWEDAFVFDGGDAGPCDGYALMGRAR